MFGPWANEVTIRHLIFMRSGISDSEIGFFNYAILNQEDKDAVYSPWTIFDYVSSLPEKDGCDTMNCTMSFRPGTHGEYSSTNFVLAGLILINQSEPGKDTWETFDLG